MFGTSSQLGYHLEWNGKGNICEICPMLAKCLTIGVSDGVL
jgi:hypothetical protein